jgi:hypothetical protein
MRGKEWYAFFPFVSHYESHSTNSTRGALLGYPNKFSNFDRRLVMVVAQDRTRTWDAEQALALADNERRSVSLLAGFFSQDVCEEISDLVQWMESIETLRYTCM